MNGTLSVFFEEETQDRAHNSSIIVMTAYARYCLQTVMVSRVRALTSSSMFGVLGTAPKRGSGYAIADVRGLELNEESPEEEVDHKRLITAELLCMA